MKKRYIVKELDDDCEDFYRYTVRDIKTKTDVLYPTESKLEAINHAEYLNANLKTRRRPKKPNQSQYTKLIPI